MDATITASPAPADPVLDLQDESTPTSISWDAFEFADSDLSLCPIDLYKVICTDPYGNDYETDFNGNYLSGTSNYCDDFEYNVDAGQREITIPGTIDSSHEGDYTFTVRGLTSHDTSLHGELSFTYTILADCGSSSVGVDGVT